METIKLLKQGKTTPTQYGTKTGWFIEHEGAQKWADCFNSPNYWCINETIEIDHLAEREWNGKTFYTIKLPKEQQENKEPQTATVTHATVLKTNNNPDIILAKLSDLENKIDKMTYLVDELYRVSFPFGANIGDKE